MQIWHCKEKCYNTSGKIISCVLVSGQKEQKVSAEDIKAALKKGTVTIDNLTLSSDNKLIDKENKVNDYIEACKTLGIKPLHIEKQDDKYVITKIPNSRVIEIPKFATHMMVSQALSVNNDDYLSGYVSQQVQSVVQKGGNTAGVDMSALKGLFTHILEALTSQATKLDDVLAKIDSLGLSEEQRKEFKDMLVDIKSKIDSSSDDFQQPVQQNDTEANIMDKVEILVEPPDLKEISDKLDTLATKDEDKQNFRSVENQLSTIDSLLEDLKNEPNVDSNLLTDMTEIRTLISENGDKLQDLKAQVAPLCTQMIDTYNRFSQKDSQSSDDKNVTKTCYDNDKGIIGPNTLLNRTTCVASNDYIWNDEDKYNTYVASNTQDKLLSYAKLEDLGNLINYYYSEYIKIARIVREFKEDEQAIISGFMESVQPFTNFTSTYKPFGDIGKKILSPIDMGANGVIKTTTSLAKGENVKKFYKQFENVYGMPQALKEFYSITDDEIADYLVSSVYYRNHFTKISTSVFHVEDKKIKNMKFRYLLRLIFNLYRSDKLNTLSQEEEDRVAVAYITVHKIMERTVNFGIDIDPFYSFNSGYINKGMGSNYLGEGDETNYKSLYLAVFRELFRCGLLLQGFKPVYLDDGLLKVFDEAIKPYNGLQLKDNDWENMKFNYYNY